MTRLAGVAARLAALDLKTTTFLTKNPVVRQSLAKSLPAVLAGVGLISGLSEAAAIGVALREVADELEVDRKKGKGGQVKAHTRRGKSGKTFRVKAHRRSV